MSMKQRKRSGKKRLLRLLLTASAVSLASGMLTLQPGELRAAAADSPLQLRSAAENMQSEIKWNPDTGSVTVRGDGLSAAFTLGSTSMTVNGRSVALDQAPYARNGRVYVPQAALNALHEASAAAQNRTGFGLASSFRMPSGKAEIISSTPDGQRLIVTEADAGSVSVLDISDTSRPSLLKTISFRALSDKAEVTSVAAMPDGKYALAVIRTGDTMRLPNPGILAVVDLDNYKIAKTYPLGIGPDSVAVSKDGRFAVIAIEDEELDPDTDEFDYPNAKRPGSIAVVEFEGGDALKGTLTDLSVNLSGVEGAIYPHEPQPEYVAINDEGTTAAVTLQENNAIALVDLAAKKVSRVFALGTTEHAADLKEDGIVSFTDTMKGRFEPDGIAFSPDGRYLITANEGDLGKNEFDDGVKAGGRSIAVWDLEGRLVYDSLNLIDTAAAKAGIYPDGRSPNKGSEVENLTVSTVRGQTLLVAAAERANAILFFDLNDAANPAYLGLIRTAGESPEGIHRVSGRDLFVSADEGTGTISFYTPRS
ncbi:choice-of-anchor I domain-containing protein [Saccharibacillus alkalitolerans]|uniref:YncE family protein n=1 Tax=Saccharibacillus alkalitolerans TaxID=2705290 RepID=A0ABX0F7W3_9BACL|nr:stalk domain-containing protein [Saccharibacillus alkalitolerans]NGZ74112.1 YncE family protein [Saccharibacillus alkalitolerans]